MGHKNKKKRFRRLPNVAVLPSMITLANGIFGFTAIYYASLGLVDPDKLLLKNLGMTYFTAGAWLIVFAMIADGLDGFVARKSGSQSDFGGELDSLSDIVSFGVAPAFLMLGVVKSSGLIEQISSLSPLLATLPGRVLWLTAAMYFCCAALRLAKFNVENTSDESSHRRFNGLPSPAAAGLIVAFVLLYSDIMREIHKEVPEIAGPGATIVAAILPLVTVLVALLMVSSIPYAHIINRYLKGRKPFVNVVIIVVITFLLFIMLQVTLVVVSVLYVSSGLVTWLWVKVFQHADLSAADEGQTKISHANHAHETD